jgi:hypothetical protein
VTDVGVLFGAVLELVVKVLSIFLEKYDPLGLELVAKEVYAMF